MKKVLFVTNIPSPYFINLFYEIKRLNKDLELKCLFWTSSNEGRQWDLNLNDLSCFYYLDSFGINATQKEMANRVVYFPKNAYSKINELNPDSLVVYEYSVSSLLALLWAKINRKKFIHVTEGTLHSECSINLLQKLFRKIVINQADWCIGCSSKSVEKLKHYTNNTSNLSKILLTTDIKPFIFNRTPNNKKDFTFLYVGSLEDIKGVDLLINAIPYTDENIHFNIVGNDKDNYKEHLITKINKMNLSSRITLYPFAKGQNLVNHYRDADAFVFPSKNDCFGLVLVEAFCSKLPIVSSLYADGVYDIVENGYNGIIVDPYNEIQLANSINEVFRNKKYVNNAFYNDATKFDIINESREFSTVIIGVLNKR